METSQTSGCGGFSPAARLSGCGKSALRKKDCWINKTREVWKQSSFANDKKYCMSCRILIWWLAHPPVWDQWALSLNRIGLAFRLFHETTSLAWSTTPPGRFYLEIFSLPSSHKLCILKLSSGSGFDGGVLMILIIDWRGWLVSWNVLDRHGSCSRFPQGYRCQCCGSIFDQSFHI